MSNSEAAEPYTIIEPLGGPLAGDVSVPGDKSISHRAVLFSAMAAGTSHLTGVLDSRTCAPPSAPWRPWAPSCRSTARLTAR